MRLFLSGLVLICLALPVAAQEIDFGDDSSPWANDGECDDKRFSGPGMDRILMDIDIGRDASDCRAGYEAGLLRLVGEPVAGASGSGPAMPSAPSGPPATPPSTTAEMPAPVPMSPAPAGGFSAGGVGKTDRVRGGGVSGQPEVAEIVIDGIRFGDDSSPVSGDGECDDRRFSGPGMAGVLSWESMARDASDCAALYRSGDIYLWNEVEAQAATSCQAIDFGDDSGEYPKDYECDDYRFEGRGVAMNLRLELAGRDASDCSRLCEYGMLSLRDYR